MRAFVFLCAMFGLTATAVAAQPGLKEFLQHLQWGAPASDVQQTLSDSGCTYKVYLTRTSQAHGLSAVRLEQSEGAAEECRAQVEQLLTGLYGAATTVKQEYGWRVITAEATFAGPMVQSSWQTPTTCINFSWKEGAGFPGSPLIVTLGDRNQACGYDDQVVTVGKRVVSVETLQKSIETDGPAQTLKTYFGCSHPEGYRLIASGDKRAVDLGEKLLDHADGCDGEMLMSSLATAIQKNPEAVLPYMTPANPETFCIPFIAEDVSPADALAILALSEQSLQKVRRPDLQHARQTCLQEIRKYQQSLHG